MELGFLINMGEVCEISVKKIQQHTFPIPRGRLSKLVQTTSVREYQDSFEEMRTRCLGLPDYFILEMFISCLKEDIQ